MQTKVLWSYSGYFYKWDIQRNIANDQIKSIHIQNDSLGQFELNQKKKIEGHYNFYFWFPIETNNNQTFILMHEQYPKTYDVRLTSKPYLHSWTRCLEITEQYNNKLFIDFNKYLMVPGSNRYPTHRQFL